jgi:hypothetical protein
MILSYFYEMSRPKPSLVMRPEPFLSYGNHNILWDISGVASSGG